MKNIILIRDNEENDYIYGFLLVKDSLENIDKYLLQERLNQMRDELDELEENGKLENEDYSGVLVVKKTLEKYKEDYKNVEYIDYVYADLEV